MLPSILDLFHLKGPPHVMCSSRIVSKLAATQCIYVTAGTYVLKGGMHNKGSKTNLFAQSLQIW